MTFKKVAGYISGTAVGLMPFLAMADTYPTYTSQNASSTPIVLGFVADSTIAIVAGIVAVLGLWVIVTGIGWVVKKLRKYVTGGHF